MGADGRQADLPVKRDGARIGGATASSYTLVAADRGKRITVMVTGTVVAITHYRYFLDNAAEWILELDRGHGIPYKGN